MPQTCTHYDLTVIGESFRAIKCTGTDNRKQLDCINLNHLTVQHAPYQMIGTASLTTESKNTIRITFSLMI